MKPSTITPGPGAPPARPGLPSPREANEGGRRGFTLLELLVTITIIVAIAAITIFALGRARDRSKTATSVNNLRQLGVASQMVASEMNGILPATTWNNPTRGHSLMYWWDPLAEHLYEAYSFDGPNQFRRIDGLFRDPGSPAGRQFKHNEMRPPKWAEIGYVVWASGRKNWNRQVRGTRLADLSKPSMQPYLTTGSMESGPDDAVATEVLFASKVLPYASWHDNQVIVLYCDGRVATIANPTFETVAPLMARENP